MRSTVRGVLGRLSRLVPASVVLASVLLFLASLLWAVLVPVYQAPDEIYHVNSVLRVAEGGGWPRPGDARLEDEVVTSRGLSGVATPEGRTSFDGGAGRPPGVPMFADVSP